MNLFWSSTWKPYNQESELESPHKTNYLTENHSVLAQWVMDFPSTFEHGDMKFLINKTSNSGGISYS